MNSVPQPASEDGNEMDIALSNLRNAMSRAMSAAVDAMDVSTAVAVAVAAAADGLSDDCVADDICSLVPRLLLDG